MDFDCGIHTGSGAPEPLEGPEACVISVIVGIVDSMTLGK